jgi:hypothetical protein
MFPAKIEMCHEQSQCVPMVFDALGISERQSGKSPIENPSRQIGPFCMASAK